tara:strand:+ start:3161 stop:3529 length:369 start_codon:yes stop_codon:yes gene_type:complete
MSELDDLRARVAELEAEKAELETTLGKFYGWRPPSKEAALDAFWTEKRRRDVQFWKDGTEPADPPVTRRELAAVLEAARPTMYVDHPYAGKGNRKAPYSPDAKLMIERLHAGQDARGEKTDE